MNQYRRNNLKVYTQGMGQLVVQPESLDRMDLYKTQLLLCPYRMNDVQLNAVADWASVSQIPIFCHTEDIQKFEEEGFGAYRFHKLDGYREVDFQGGAIEFFPAKRLQKKISFMSRLKDALEHFSFVAPEAFHILIRPIDEKSVLFLASPKLDFADLQVFKRLAPNVIVGSREYSRDEWKVVGEHLGMSVIFEQDVEFVVTSHRSKLELSAFLATAEVG